MDDGREGVGGEEARAAAARGAALRGGSARLPRGDGEPHVIPVCPVFDGFDTVYVDIGPKYRTAKQIAENPRATVIIDDYADDWDQLKRVILRCSAPPATDSERAAAWRRIRRKFPQYRAIGWQPRLTLALRIEEVRHEGITG